MNPHFPKTAGALAALAAIVAAVAAPAAQAQVTTDSIVVTGKRSARVSQGATNLPLDVKDTPQSISTLDREEMEQLGLVGGLDALRYATGINVEQYETNRATLNARGFDIMLTQIDGGGMTNDWGTVVGQLDSFLFERIEVIRGANGLLTGVGNASGTVNYVRKRPTNQDSSRAQLTLGSHDQVRLAVDHNQRLSADGSWAGRLVATAEDRDSYLRALHDRRGNVYGVVDGQIGTDGMLTLGFTHQEARQESPMWGSLTVNRANGTQAEFPRSSSTSQDWTHWNTRSTNAFVEYAHMLATDWDAKLSLNHNRGASDTKLFYAYSLSGSLNDDDTGLIGWPYRSDGTTRSTIAEASVTGRFGAFGRRHETVFGLSHSRQKSVTLTYDIDSAPGPVAPAFPYPGDFYPEPTWGATRSGADGTQQLTRVYAVARLALSDPLKAVVGVNGVRLKRDGTSIYGGGVALDNETTSKLSPYVGLTYELAPDALLYASYSDIFQAQDQRGADGRFLAPMKGVNAEAGVKAEWLDRQLLTTAAVFGAEQKGLATEVGFDPVSQQSVYAPQDVRSRGVELEATGRLSPATRLTAGYTHLRLTGPDGRGLYEWVPRNTFKLRLSQRLAAWPKLTFGGGLRWQSEVSKNGGARQGAYAVADAFADYAVSDRVGLRLNVNNLFDQTYLRTVQYGAIYGAPRSAALTLQVQL